MAKEQYSTTVDGLIELLTEVKRECGGNTRVQINVQGHECVTGLNSVCLDNDMGNNQALVYLETTMQKPYCPATFNFYTQGKEI